jgi:hypothetical protein
MKQIQGVGSLLIVLGSFPLNAAILTDFDGGGVPYELGSFRTAPGPAVTGGGPNGNYLTVLNNIGDGGNYLSFGATGTAGWQSATFTMNFATANVAADGFSVGFLDTATHGNSGVVRVGSTGFLDVEERGLYSNSIGVGFRTFNGTNATVNYNGLESGDVGYSLNAGNWQSLEITLTKDGADVLVDTTIFSEADGGGTAQNVFSNFGLAGAAALDDFRVQVSGRTGGSAMDLWIDDLSLTTQPIPESSTLTLAGFCTLTLLMRRKRAIR